MTLIKCILTWNPYRHPHRPIQNTAMSNHWLWWTVQVVLIRHLQRHRRRLACIPKHKSWVSRNWQHASYSNIRSISALRQQGIHTGVSVLDNKISKYVDNSVTCLPDGKSVACMKNEPAHYARWPWSIKVTITLMQSSGSLLRQTYCFTDRKWLLTTDRERLACRESWLRLSKLLFSLWGQYNAFWCIREIAESGWL